MDLAPMWMHSMLELLSVRADAGAVESLPLRSLDMEAQHHLAFRTLQRGVNTGKVVLRIATRRSAGSDGVHAVSGGTGGLGLLTGRWLAQHGACQLVLASRSGVVAHDAGVEWEAVQATGTEACLAQCDTRARRLTSAG